MKNLRLGLLAAVVTLSSVSFGRSLVFVPPQEKVLVKQVELRGNFMPPLPPGGTLEPLAEITAQVSSNGCTDATSFRVDVQDVLGGQKVTLVRVRPDHCRAFFPEGTEITVRTHKIRFGSEVFLGNPVRVNDSTTH